MTRVRDIEQEAAEERLDMLIGGFVSRLTQGAGLGGLEDGRLTGFTLRLPTEEDPSTLLIVRAQAGKEKWIAFVGAYRLGDALLAWRKRDQAKRMKWREDVPWSERGGV